MSEYPCKMCCFFVPFKQVPDEGECRRFPPTVQEIIFKNTWNVQERDIVINFPTVSEKDWCGEYQPQVGERNE